MPPLPLSSDQDIQVSEMPDGVYIQFSDVSCSLQDVYVIMADMSGKQDGRSVVFRDLLPGIDLHVQSRWQHENGTDMLLAQWQGARYLLERLIESDPPETMFTVESPIAISTVSRARTLELPHTAMQVRWL